MDYVLTTNVNYDVNDNYIIRSLIQFSHIEDMDKFKNEYPLIFKLTE